MSKQPLSERAANPCTECKRPPATTAYQQAHSDWCDETLSYGCYRRTVANLRAELAAAEKLNAVERAVVEAAVSERGLSSVTDNAEWCAALAATERAVDTLIALRNEVKSG